MTSIKSTSPVMLGTEIKPPSFRFLLGAALLVTLIFTIWGGVPPANEIPVFAIGVAVLLGVILVIGAAGWYLLGRPMASEVVRKDTLPNWFRLLLAVLLSVVSLNNVIGSAWDESWHYQYGIPFGRDITWVPHLLIYTFLIAVVLIAGFGCSYLLNVAKGTVQERFRANPTFSILALVGIFMLFAIPADPVWHGLYGFDISAWSLPHIVLIWASACSMFLVPMLILSTLPVQAWASVRRVTLKDMLMLAAIAFIEIDVLIVLTTEWDGFKYLSDNGRLAVMARPSWLLTAIIVLFATILGTLGLRLTRKIGSATLAGIIGLVVRTIMLTLLNFHDVTANAWLVSLLVMITLDLGYGVNQWRKGTIPSWLVAGLFSTLGLLVALPFMGQLFVYPQLTMNQFPVVIITGLLAAWGGCWFGTGVGNLVARAKLSEAPSASEHKVMHMVTPLVFAVQVLVILILVATVKPPTP